MSIIRTVILAASLVAVAATAYASTSRSELDSGYHGNTAVETYR
jgi:hypothetical protein